MKLHIDTTISKKAVITLDDLTLEGGNVLELIDEALSKKNIKLENLEEITVNQGPGSYTGLKVGSAVTNSLNFALGKDSIVLPKYE